MNPVEWAALVGGVLLVAIFVFASRRRGFGMTPEYLEARRKLLWNIAWYGGVALGPLIIIGVVSIIVMGPKAKASLYVLIPVFVWGYFWINMMLRYVRSHPLPNDQSIVSSPK
jgi:hypothetical protein